MEDSWVGAVDGAVASSRPAPQGDSAPLGGDVVALTGIMGRSMRLVVRVAVGGLDGVGASERLRGGLGGGVEAGVDDSVGVGVGGGGRVAALAGLGVACLVASSAATWASRSSGTC